MTGLLPTGFTYFEAPCGYCDQSLHRMIKDMQDLTHSSLCIIICNCSSHVFYPLLVSGNCCVLLSSYSLLVSCISPIRLVQPLCTIIWFTKLLTLHLRVLKCRVVIRLPAFIVTCLFPLCFLTSAPLHPRIQSGTHFFSPPQQPCYPQADPSSSALFQCSPLIIYTQDIQISRKEIHFIL